jgi:hypothetical protein
MKMHLFTVIQVVLLVCLLIIKSTTAALMHVRFQHHRHLYLRSMSFFKFSNRRPILKFISFFKFSILWPFLTFSNQRPMTSLMYALTLTLTDQGSDSNRRPLLKWTSTDVIISNNGLI